MGSFPTVVTEVAFTAAMNDLEVADTFAGAASATSMGQADSGQWWQALTGIWGLDGSGHAYLATQPVAGPGTVTGKALVVAGPNMTTSVTLSTVQGATGLLFRFVDQLNYWQLRASAVGGGYFLENVIGGVAATSGTVLVNAADGDVLTVTADGSTITATVNSTSVTVTSTVNQSGNRVGIFATSASTARFAAFTSVYNWTNISANVLNGQSKIDRGSQHELAAVNAGTATIVLQDFDRRFDPSNTAGPYYGSLLPMRRIRMRATWAGRNLVPDSELEGYQANSTIAGTATWTATDPTVSVVVGRSLAFTVGASTTSDAWWSAAIPVTPGAVMTVSGVIDAKKALNNLVDLRVMDTGRGTTYAVVTQTSRVSGLVSATFTVPGGVTAVVVRFDIGGAVLDGTVTCTQPQLEVAAAATPYMPGVWDTTLSPAGLGCKTSWPLFRGYVERWPSTWNDESTATIQVGATDALGRLARTTVATIPAGMLLSGPRAYWRLGDDFAYPQDFTGGGARLAYSSPVAGTGPALFALEPTALSVDLNLATIYGIAPAGTVAVGPQSFTLAVQTDSLKNLSGSFGSPGPFLVSGGNATAAQCWGLSWQAAPGPQYYGQLHEGTHSTVSWLSLPRDRAFTLFLVRDVENAKWVVYAYDGTSLYTTTTETFAALGVGTGTDLGTPTFLQLGNDGTSIAGSLGSMSGNFSEFAVWDYALSAAQVAQWHQASTAAANAASAVTGGCATQVNQVLDDIGWPANKRVVSTSTAEATMPAATVDNTQYAASLLTNVANSDAGIAFVDASGLIRWRDRDALVGQVRPTWAFGNDGTSQVPMSAPAPSNDIDRFYTAVSISTATGTITRTNEAGRAIAGALQPLSLSAPGGSANLVKWLLARFGTPTLRLDAITIQPFGGLSGAVWEAVLGVELGDRVWVRFLPFGGSGTQDYEVRVEHIDHKAIGRDNWTVTFQLEACGPTTPGTGWVADDPVFGVADSTTVGWF